MHLKVFLEAELSLVIAMGRQKSAQNCSPAFPFRTKKVRPCEVCQNLSKTVKKNKSPALFCKIPKHKGFMLLVLQSLHLCSFLFPVSLHSPFLCQRIPSYIPNFLKNTQSRAHAFLESAAVAFRFTGGLGKRRRSVPKKQIPRPSHRTDRTKLGSERRVARLLGRISLELQL